MKKLIEEVSLELWKTIQELDTPFEWRLNWFLHRKIDVLWRILDDLIRLQKEENNIKIN